MSLVIAFPSAFVDKQALSRAIKKIAPRMIRVRIEGNCIVCQSSDAVELASRLAGLFGIEKVAIAKKASSRFSELVQTIVEVGTKVIMPDDTFYVKVIQETNEHDYVNRDVEFAASGMLTGRLSSIHARPAKAEEEASNLLLTVVGKESAYVCIKVSSGPGGLVAGSHGSILCSIHSSLSFLSCLIAAKSGFEPTIVLPYADERELLINAKLAQLFALKTGIEKQRIFIIPINLTAKGIDASLLKEKIVSKVLILYEHNRIVFPLSAAAHPIWLIESIIQDALSSGKVPYVPLIFMSSELVRCARDAGIELNQPVLNITKASLRKYENIIDSEAKVAIKHTKRVELKVGPNYLHDIIDSI